MGQMDSSAIPQHSTDSSNTSPQPAGVGSKLPPLKGSGSCAEALFKVQGFTHPSTCLCGCLLTELLSPALCAPGRIILYLEEVLQDVVNSNPVECFFLWPGKDLCSLKLEGG